MAMEQQNTNPSHDTLDHVKGLLKQKTKEVILCVTNSALVVKDCIKKVSINNSVKVIGGVLVKGMVKHNEPAHTHPHFGCSCINIRLATGVHFAPSNTE